MVLADAEGVEADLVGQHRLLDQVRDPLLARDQRAVPVGRVLDEGIESEFHRQRLLL